MKYLLLAAVFGTIISQGFVNVKMDESKTNAFDLNVTQDTTFDIAAALASIR